MFKIDLRTTKFILPLLSLLLSAAALVHLSHRAALPRTVEDVNNGLLLTYPDQAADTLYKVDGIHVSTGHHLEQMLKRSSYKDSLTLTIHPDSIVTAELIPFYTNRQLLIRATISLALILIATVIFWRARAKGEKYFAICGFFLAFAYTAGAAESYHHLPVSLPLVLLGLLLLPQSVLIFVYFCYHFPRPKLAPECLRKRKTILQFCGFGITIALWLLFFAQYFSPSPESLDAFTLGAQITFWLLLTAFACGLLLVYRNASTHADPISARKLHWILAGISFTGMPLLLFSLLPQWLGGDSLLPVLANDLFLLLLYASFMMGILYFRKVEIEKWLNLTLVYALSILFILPFVIVTTLLLQGIDGNDLSRIPTYSAILAGLIIAFCFEPLRRWVKPVVDRTLFPLRHQRLNILKEAELQISKQYDPKELARILPPLLSGHVNPRMQAIFTKSDDSWVKAAGEKNHLTEKIPGWLRTQHHAFAESPAINRASLDRVEAEETPAVVDLPHPDWVLVYYIMPNFVWLFGPKSSGDLYWREDCELIQGNCCKDINPA